MDTVLALNAGSATLKFAVYADGRELARGLVDPWGGEDQRLRIDDEAGAPLPGGREGSIGFLLGWISDRWPQARLAAIGHRIVHGGERFAGPVVVTAEVEAALEALCPLAPLHQPWGLMGLRLARLACPEAPQVASFDTAFHRTMPPVATRLALPRDLAAEGVRRYGFHGLSYAYVSRRLGALDPTLAAGRAIVAHLGSGASLCALRNGASVETTMGFSTLDGLVMATRPGALDPGVVLHLLQAKGMTADEVSDLLYHRSGLYGVSGISGDMRALLASPEAAAKEAIDLYVHRIVREIGALTALLGGLDGLVFTGGVGENAAPIRAAVCERLDWLGVRLDEPAGGAGERLISRPGALPVWIVPTDEEQVIADEAGRTVKLRTSP